MKTKNAECNMFMGHTLQLRCEVTDLSRNDQLALLKTLMLETGTTAAILSADNGMEMCKLIGEQWERFAAGPKAG